MLDRLLVKGKLLWQWAPA